MGDGALGVLQIINAAGRREQSMLALFLGLWFVDGRPALRSLLIGWVSFFHVTAYSGVFESSKYAYMFFCNRANDTTTPYLKANLGEQSYCCRLIRLSP